MAALKDSAVRPVGDPHTAARGRDDYALVGVLRTKPGRADAPPTLSMSCSDKIAMWNVLGFQGGLAALLIRPLYIKHIIIGGVPQDEQPSILEDCDRALWRRAGLSARQPAISFTSLEFVHSRASLSSSLGTLCNTSSNESLCWIADSALLREIIVNGYKRGVPPKHQLRTPLLPRISKLALFRLYASLRPVPLRKTYFDVKQSAHEYQAAKLALIGPGGGLHGWKYCGAPWQSFDVEAEIIREGE